MTNGSSTTITNTYVAPVDPEPPVEIPEEPPVDPEPPVEIPEEDVPTGETPVEPPVEIPEEEVPTGDIPATGDASAIWMAMSAMSGAGLFLARKKREDEE